MLYFVYRLAKNNENIPLSNAYILNMHSWEELQQNTKAVSHKVYILQGIVTIAISIILFIIKNHLINNNVDLSIEFYDHSCKL